jgi:putative FmdB family regulatory protein
MPTYEYRCPNGHDFEKFYRTISASEAEIVCPQCGAMGVRQVSGGAGLVFKGSGFYLTDYGKNAHATRGNSKPSTSGKESDKSESSGSSSKPVGDAAGGTGAAAAADSGAAKSKPKRDA